MMSRFRRNQSDGSACVRRHARQLPAALLMVLAVNGAHAQSTEADSQGQALAAQLVDQHPTDNYTVTGTLKLRNADGTRSELPSRFQTIVSPAKWAVVYQVGDPGHVCQLTIIHADGQPDAYFYATNSAAVTLSTIQDVSVKGAGLTEPETMVAFAGSDFWIADLGLEFLHWPQQKMLKKEMKRGQGCSVLESTNSHPANGGYGRVVSWIDNETSGIVQAEAYDPSGKLLKEFYPKDFKKVNGQWRVGMMEMDNDQTDSRSQLKFDLNSAVTVANPK